MKKSLLILHILLIAYYGAFAQGIGIGTLTPDGSAALDITHTGKGLLIPRMSTASINTIPSPAKGLMIYDSVVNQLMVNMGTPAAPSWQAVASKGAWNLGGNAAVNPATQFVGSTDNQPLRFRVNNIPAGELHPLTGNVFWGVRAGQSNTTGFSNVALGTDALKLNLSRTNLVAIGDSALFNNSNGSVDANEGTGNTAIGSKSLYANTRGAHNTGIGFRSLSANTTGSLNSAFGSGALHSNTTGRFNVGVGVYALYENSTGDANTAVGYRSLGNSGSGNNTAVGFESLAYSTSGTENTGVGLQALFATTLGSRNAAFGQQALYNNTTGGWNTAVGYRALFSSATANANTAFGYQALHYNTTGSGNTAAGLYAIVNNTTGLSLVGIGSNALLNNTTGSANVGVGSYTLAETTAADGNTAVGHSAGSGYNLGWNNTFLGAYATAVEHGIFNSVAIGQGTVATASNQVRLGNFYSSSIGGSVAWTNLSDGRFKKNIQEDVKGLDFIMKLRPVTYQMDITGINNKLYAGKSETTTPTANAAELEKQIHTGFLAQEVEQAAKATGYDFSGVDKPKNPNDFYGLRYSEFVVPIVKAMQEQQQMIEELKKQNAALLKRIEALEKK